MILVDTSVWVSHFRGEESVGKLSRRLDEDRVLLHPWVFGELVLGNLGRRRSSVAADLRQLPEAPVVPHEEVLVFIEERRLWARGLGWVDVHLLSSALVAGAGLWSLDRNLSHVAKELGIEVGSGAVD